MEELNNETQEVENVESVEDQNSEKGVAQESEESNASSLSVEDIERILEDKLKSNPSYNNYKQYEEFLESKKAKEEKKLDYDNLSFDDLTDAVKELNKKSSTTKEELSQRDEILNQIYLRELNRDFKESLDKYNSNWMDKFEDEDSFVKASEEAIKYLPADKQEQLLLSQKGESFLDKSFMDSLDTAMKAFYFDKLSDPESMDKFIKNSARRSSLQDRTLPSNDNGFANSKEVGGNSVGRFIED